MMFSLAISSILLQTSSQMVRRDSMTQQQLQPTSLIPVPFRTFLRQFHWNQRMRAMVLKCYLLALPP